MSKLPITGAYPPEWPQIGDRVRAEVGHRCIRCAHPFEVGKHGKGEWSPCDDKCDHPGPLAFVYGEGDLQMTAPIDASMMPPGIPITAYNLVRLNRDTPVTNKGERRVVCARWRILTVHHLDGNKSNCAWYNLLALCQRCHLTIQSRVNPEVPYFLEHDEWFKPYVAGFYAKKYEGREITREEAMARMFELLAHERLA